MIDPRGSSRLFLVLLLTLFLPLTALGKETLVIPAGYVGNYTEVLNIPIRYHQVGHGPDILFIHGRPGSIEDWQPLVEALAPHYRLTFYDRPGNGFSGKPRHYTLAQNADVALALIEQLRLDHPVVVGHSYGGGVVMALAVRKPENIKAFVSIGGCAYPSEPFDIIFSLLRIPYVGRGIIALLPKKTNCEMIRDGILESFHPNEKDLPADYVDARCKIWSQPKNTLTLAREGGSFNAELKKIVPQYPGITHTIYLVHGDQDKLVSVEESKKVNASAPRAPLTVLADTGHMVQYIRTAELIKVIEAAARP